MKTIVSIALFTLLLAACLWGQNQTPAPTESALPPFLLFAGASYEPNAGLNSMSVDLGGAKLIGATSYLGVVAHLTSKGTTPFQIATRVQLHGAQKVAAFRGAPIFWTGEVGPDFVPTTSTAPPPSLAIVPGTSVGYALGSGPLISIAIGKRKRTFLMPHAEAVKGSLQDLGWRAGILIGFGSD